MSKARDYSIFALGCALIATLASKTMAWWTKHYERRYWEGKNESK